MMDSFSSSSPKTLTDIGFSFSKRSISCIATGYSIPKHKYCVCVCRMYFLILFHNNIIQRFFIQCKKQHLFHEDA